MHKMALCFWYRGSDALAKALTAQTIYVAMANVYRSSDHHIEERIYDQLIKNGE